MIDITIKFFGPLRELANTEEIKLQVKPDTCVEDLVWLLGQRYPNMRDHFKHVSFSIDNEYAAKDTRLQDGNTVGLLPPISGGRS